MLRKIMILFLSIFVIFLGCAGLGKLSKKNNSNTLVKDKSFHPSAVQHFIRGSVYELRGDYKSAHIEYSQALLFDTSSAAVYNKIAEQYIRLQNVQSAQKMLLTAERRFPNNLETRKMLVSIYFSLRQWTNAEKELTKIVELDARDIDARYRLITVYLHQGKDLKIAEQYEKIIKLGFGSAEMEIKIGDIYLKRNYHKKAEKVFQEFLSNYPDDERSYLAMAKLSMAQKDTATAMEWYQKGVNKNRDFATCLEELRDIYISQKKWHPAIILLKQSVAKDSLKIENYLRLGELYFRKGDTTLAVSQFSKTTDLFPDDFRGFFSFGSINYQLGNLDPAEQSLKKAIELNEKFERGWTLLGFIFMRNSRLEEAEQHFKKAVEIFPESGAVNYFMGSVLQQQKKLDDALPYLLKALELNPKDVNTINALAMIYDEKQLYDNSDEMYLKALKIRPDDPLLMNNYSYSLSERGIKLDEAKAMSEKAVAADSTNGAYLDTLGWIHFKLGDYQKALKFISKASEVRDNSAEVWEHLGDVYEKLSDIKNAKIYWNKAIELDESRTWLLDKLKDK
jgi:tetratricopeptide (TPR) repeat protein